MLCLLYKYIEILMRHVLLHSIATLRSHKEIVYMRSLLQLIFKSVRDAASRGVQQTGNTAEYKLYITALEKQTALFAVWIALQSIYQERVALRCLPFSLFLSADLYFSSFAHFKAEFDCFGFAGRCLLRPGVYLLGWYQTCDNTGLQPRLFSVLLVIFFFLRVYGLTACCTVSKEEQGSGLVAD